MVSRHVNWKFVGTLVVLPLLWLLMMLMGTGPLDRSIYQALYAGDRRAWAAIAHFFTSLGEPTLLIPAAVAAWLWLWYAGRGRLGLALLAIAMIGRLLSESQKYWIARVRPDLEVHLVVVKTQSFPSGHASSSMIFYLALALALASGTRWARAAAAAAICLSLLIGTSRVMLGVHWPSDVIGGWAFGLLWVLVTMRAAERLLRAGPPNAQAGRDDY
ncbi:MAG TPA: phosphatase PAP2 family protein [Sphingomicrobium sp.]|nr:phosphatase PAP2 family protein [Sphingomicrobium sp.]